jgi:hypothetical protein
MKFTLAIAALGAVSAIPGQDYYTTSITYPTHEPVWSLRSVNDHKTDSVLQGEFGTHATGMANARPPLRSHMQLNESSSSSDSSSSKSSSSSSDSDDDKKVQMEGSDEEVDHSKETFAAGEHEKLGDGGYKRVTPVHFAADNDDIFMRSMIEQYAFEGKNKDGSPNGSFTMTEATARAAASEVLDTHKGLKGAARDAYLKTYFPRTWAHFDVNREGKVGAIVMPQFMRFLCSDQQMYLQP